MDLEKLCREVIRIAKDTGEFIAQNKPALKDIRISEKDFNNFVTSVDLESENRIVSELLKILPEAGIIGEEKTNDKNSNEYNWVIDPLDGTTNFIHGVPCFAISIALMYRSDILLGVVYEINLKECFYACKGSGAFLNGSPIHVSDSSNLKQSLIATGFPYYDYGRMAPWLKLFQYLMENTQGLRRLGSAATDLAYVACSRFDGFYEYALNAWDVAAGSLIVAEAGGIVTDFSGTSDFIFGKEIIAATPDIYQSFSESIAHFFSDNN